MGRRHGIWSSILTGIVAILVTVCSYVYWSDSAQLSIRSAAIAMLEKTWDSSITATSFRFNPFLLRFDVANGIIHDRHSEVAWSFDRLCARANIAEMLFAWSIGLHISIDTAFIAAAPTDKYKVIPFLARILTTSSPEMPVHIESIKINQVQAVTDDRSLTIACTGSGIFSRTGEDHEAWTGAIFLRSGTIAQDGVTVMANMRGRATFALPDDAHNRRIAGACSFAVPCIGGNQRFIGAFLSRYGCHNVALFSSDRQTALRATLINNHFVSDGKIAVKDLVSYITTATAVSGSVHFKMDGTFDQTLACTGSFSSAPISLYKHDLGQLDGSFDVHADIVSGSLVLRNNKEPLFSAQGLYDISAQGGNFIVQNQAPIALDALKRRTISAHNLRAQGTITKNKLMMHVNADSHDLLREQNDHYEITMAQASGALDFVAHLPSGTLTAHATGVPSWHCDAITYTPDDQERTYHLITRSDQSLILEGSIPYVVVKQLMPLDLQQSVLGKQGEISVSIDQTDLTNITGNLNFSESDLFIAQSLNLVKSISCSFQIKPLLAQIIAKNLKITCFRGKIVSPEIVCVLNIDGTLDHLYAPLAISHLLVNWKRDFYAFVSGKLIFEKKGGKKAKAQGLIVLEKSLLKENIFSSQASDLMLMPTIGSLNTTTDGCDILLKIESKEPIITRTPAIETKAHIALGVRAEIIDQKINHPQISGSITLEKGTIRFLRNELSIVDGKIEFVPHKIDDPLIELTARSRIKKYLVTMSVQGSLQKPTIILDASPDLTEEQVLAILLAGSENASLQTDLPAMLMQNLSALLFSPSHRQPKVSQFFRKITKPFEYIQITPNFADQSGRGGIKGSLSIDVSPQLHATLQKDFTLQEDFAIQVEYFLTDDFNIKAVRDVRGDLGAEIEMRLKF